MNLQDDPRLTRYALGEMNDEERTAFERELTDADRAEVESIRALAGTLATELKAEPIAKESLARLPMMSIRDEQRSSRTRWILAAAASVAVAGLVAVALKPAFMRARETSLASRIDVLAAQDESQMRFGPAEVDPTITSQRPASGAEKSKRNFAFGDFIQNPSASLARGGPVTDELSRMNVEAGIRQQLDTGGEYIVQTPKLVTQNGAGDRARGRANLAFEHEGIALSARGGRIAGDADGDRIVDAGLTPAGAVAIRASADAQLQQVEARMRGETKLSERGYLATTQPPEVATADSYAKVRENPFIVPEGNSAISTFGIDVDTASYANVRRFLTNNTLPPADAVRIEELVNYFPTSDVPPTDGKPFATYAEVAWCPWTPSHQLVRVALKAKEVDVTKRPPSNLVFLVDVSGSMNEPTKLPLVKRGLQRLVDQLGENDRVAIVVYAGNSGLALPSTNAANKDAIRAAIDKLEAGGSTNGGQGIELAYGVAQAQFIAGGANRVILCTDGDFNVGVVDRNQLNALITEKAKAGVFLNVLGFGRGNLKDDTMESLADKGNGQYAYIDSDREAQKVLVEQASGTLLTVAKDVKIQIEFNPAAVRSYRLIGYENRLLAKEDFNNDLKDAGEIGAGHNVVALYEIDPTSNPRPTTNADGLKYQSTPTPIASAPNATELLTLKLRYKAPDAPLAQGTSELIERTLTTSDRTIDQASPDFQFAAAVAGFGMMLRGSPNRGDVSWPTIAALAKSGLGPDVGGHRAEFLTLVDRAASLMK